MKKLLLALILFPSLTMAASNHHNNYNGSNAIQGQIGINKLNSTNASNSRSKLSSNNNIMIEGDSQPVRSSNAPTIISTSDCLGSYSAGGQGQFLGLSFGGTKESKPCNIREFAKMYIATGDYALANAILCQDKIVRKSIESIGKACPSKNDVREEVCAYPTEECKKSKR